MTHTPESDAEIVRLRALGHTYAVIGRALGMSKNAVLGRALRRLPVFVQKKPLPPKDKPAQDFPPRGHCLFSTDKNMPYHWCGKPTGSPDMPWCPEHARLVYTRLPNKEPTAP